MASSLNYAASRGQARSLSFVELQHFSGEWDYYSWDHLVVLIFYNETFTVRLRSKWELSATTESQVEQLLSGQNFYVNCVFETVHLTAMLGLDLAWSLKENDCIQVGSGVQFWGFWRPIN